MLEYLAIVTYVYMHILRMYIHVYSISCMHGPVEGVQFYPSQERNMLRSGTNTYIYAEIQHGDSCTLICHFVPSCILLITGCSRMYHSIHSPSLLVSSPFNHQSLTVVLCHRREWCGVCGHLATVYSVADM